MNFSGCRIGVVGDIMLDKYYIGKVERISPEAPVPVVNITSEESRLGGAANVAHNICNLGGTACLCGVVGHDLAGREVERLAAQRGITTALVKTTFPTIIKARVIGGRQQIVRVDQEQAGELTPGELARLEREIAKGIEGTKVIILSDYGKGVISSDLCVFLLALADRHRVPVIVDPKGVHWEKYRGAAWVTPNLKELGDIAGHPVINDDRAVEESGREVLRRYGIDRLLVTRSERGMSLLSEATTLHIPTQAQEVFDVSGAGDTVVATLALALAAGLPEDEAVRVANRAAGVVVRKMGTATLTVDELNGL
ncbi:MAG: D-glycero-beta-D-manno-heptose-7-phosphate kinase [Odoribacteraceae bacterium]|jgi:D-beta-D-heptose 7-phosphate kinase/D-beta-D-heptose 1-phosphate adenosyltransferase|nr:D-glycero-beta-D-manno-heptose-7-phosphate kinase [Odoribacteraceae bacterium]